ncbi:MAG: M56 family metallopeptidase [Parahaliea sp.]
MSELAYAGVQALVSWLVLTVAVSQLVSWGYPLFRRFARRGRASDRALAQFSYGVLGPLVAAISVVLIMLPESAALLVPSHCHHGSCLPHRPEIGFHSPAGAILVAASLVVLLLVVVAFQRTLRHARRRLLALSLLSFRKKKDDVSGDIVYSVVESPAQLAWCAGMLRPRVFISTGMLAELDRDELSAVLAHERAHARRRDNLLQVVLRWFTLAWSRSQRARLLADFASSSEQSCDEAACARPGARAVLIRLLERLHPRRGVPAGGRQSGFQEPDIQERLDALRNAAQGDSLALAWLFLAGLWLVGMVLLTGITHRLIEVFTFT